MANAVADDSSSEEVIIRRKPIVKAPTQQASSSSEEESEQVRAASLGLRVRAKVNYKEKGEKDIYKSEDDDEMVSAPMQVLMLARGCCVVDCVSLTKIPILHSKTVLTPCFCRRRRKRKSHTTATVTRRRAAPASPV
jgi:hypothetical protein